ncbi:hypothetical protein CDD82_6531 [Ophiocordyceps australis]|uniref:Major facilitator superfamily (MFS) profile domain-containing protein n=1 Tax=Ophiocordyceps australis TaxID=1399860 RepID=A0A2C5YRL0_9HYPO|nr:hypothetical protein CDD82_6531 [Ophiocordyceps australis]
MDALHRMLSRPNNKPYRTKHLAANDASTPPTLDANGLVVFAPTDIENPKNWSVARRWAITLASVTLVMNATFASSAPSGCIPSLARHFDVSREAAALTITLFLLGYCAGPLIFAPLSELYGRRCIFYLSFTAYIAFNFLCAFAPNFAALLVGRFITGTLVSAPLSNAPGLLADIWDPIERGNAMAGFTVMVWVGPALGPVVAGFLELKKDWRWSFYVLLWLGALTWLIMLTIPETYAPTILRHKAQRLRRARIPGYENVRAASEIKDQGFAAVFKVALTRPWVILFDPISFLCAIYMSVVYTLLYMLFEIYPIVFQEKRGWNSGVGELPLIGTVVGACLGGIIVSFESHLRTKKVRSGKLKMQDIRPEDRLSLTMVGGITFAISMFWLAWTAEYNSIHWIAPTLAGVFLSTSMLFIFVGFLNYLVDSYLQFAASAIAANTIARSACGAAAPLFTNQMFTALGVGGGGSLIAGIATLLAVIPFMFYKYGPAIRRRSRFAKADPVDKQPADEEAAVVNHESWDQSSTATDEGVAAPSKEENADSKEGA